MFGKIDMLFRLGLEINFGGSLIDAIGRARSGNVTRDKWPLQ